jgi:hypothetical protein
LIAILDSLYHLMGRVFVEWPARKKTIDNLIYDLATTAQTVQARLDAAADTPQTRK